MQKFFIGAAAASVVTLGAAAQQAPAPQTRAPKMAVAHAPAAAAPASMPIDAQNELVAKYCGATCHSDKMKSGGVSLAHFDAAHATDHADVAEAMIKKLRAGMMPPPGVRRPDAAAVASLGAAASTTSPTCRRSRPR